MNAAPNVTRNAEETLSAEVYFNGSGNKEWDGTDVYTGSWGVQLDGIVSGHTDVHIDKMSLKFILRTAASGPIRR